MVGESAEENVLWVHQEEAAISARTQPITEEGIPQTRAVASRSEERLSEVNQHFRRKAAAIINDDAAVRLLASIYSRVLAKTSDFDFCQDGRSLAKLTAAHFREADANGMYITHRGQRFIDYLNATGGSGSPLEKSLEIRRAPAYSHTGTIEKSIH